MAPGPPAPLPFHRGQREPRSLTFLVGGKAFELPRPLLAIHSPDWAQRLAEDPKLMLVELEGEADSFGAFTDFLLGADGEAGEVNAENLLPLLHWGRELGVDYVAGQCEAFLLTGRSHGLDPIELLEVSARYELPRVYTRATEAVAQGAHHLEVPEEGSHEAVPGIFRSEQIREDSIRAHLSMGALVHDGEMQKRHRFADHTGLRDPEQKARVLWKSKRRQQPVPDPPKDHDWRCTEAVWPHHSMYGEDWTVVPLETQPTQTAFRSGAISGRSAALNERSGFGSSHTLHMALPTEEASKVPGAMMGGCDG